MRALIARHHPWILLVGLAAAIRLPLVFSLGTLWNDEAFSWHFARMPLGEMLRLLAIDVHPPLHAVVLHGWMKAFGDGAVALRGLSFVFAIAGLIAFLALAREIFGKREALMAGVLFALSPLMAYYGADARMYAMTFLLACLSALLFWRMTEGEERLREAWMWASLALALTHVTGALVLAGQALYLLTSSERRERFWRLLPRFALIGLVFAVWFLPAAAFRLQDIDKEWQFRSAQEDLGAPTALLYWVWLGREKVKIVAAAVVAALLLSSSGMRQGLHMTRRGVFLLCWLAATVAPFLIFPNVTPRYLIAAVPPFFLLLVRGYQRVTGVRMTALVFFVAAICFVSIPGLAVQYATRPYEWDKVVDWIAERKRPLGDPVVFAWFSDRLAFEATAAPPFRRDLSVFGYSGRPDLNLHGLYPFDDDFSDDKRYVAHAGTLVIRREDLDRLLPVVTGADRLFFIPNDYLALADGGRGADAVAEWLNGHGWYLAEKLDPVGRTPGVWLMVRNEKAAVDDGATR